MEDIKCSHTGTFIVVHQGLDAGTLALQSPKTKNGIREVDLHPALAVAINSLIGTRATGFVFHSAKIAFLNDAAFNPFRTP